MQPPTEAEALDVVAAAKSGAPTVVDAASETLGAGGLAPLVPPDLAERAADLAANQMHHIFPDFPGLDHILTDPKLALAPAPGPAPAPAPVTAAIGDKPTLPPPRRGPPKPPVCAPEPHQLQKADVQMSMLPFRPKGAVGEARSMPDGGTAWKLENGGWSFQYPDMAARLEPNGQSRMAWPDKKYAIETSPEGVSYHKDSTVIHRGVDGDLVYHTPSGTMHQHGDTVIYHYCEPNTIVYHTPSGLVYYTNEGMTYRGSAGLAHFSREGDVDYQGVGGITRQDPNGVVTHWTNSGTIRYDHDGSIMYTPVGEAQPHAVSPDTLGPDPFPGPPLTNDQLEGLVKVLDIHGAEVNTTQGALEALGRAKATVDAHEKDVAREAEEIEEREKEKNRPTAPSPGPLAPSPSAAPAPGTALMQDRRHGDGRGGR